ncbi:MAG: tetratricopeptide repeat protein [Magnetococcales bacterium]|nr:tetratricopeptide repeat protein [Magnetococcales bacterium]
MTNNLQTAQQLSIDKAYKQAYEHFNAQRYSDADKLCTAIIQAVPNHIDAINLLGVIAQKVGRNDLATELFQQAINIDSSRALLYYNLGTSLFQLGREEEAVKTLKTALEKEPGNRQISDYLNTIQKPDIGIKSSLNSAEEFLQQGISYHQTGQLDAAIQCYRKTLELNPEHAVAHSNMGFALQTTGELEQAVSSYQKAITFKPDYAEAYYNLGVALNEQGKLELAVASYNQAITIKPDYVKAYNNLVNILTKLKGVDEGLHLLQATVEKGLDDNAIATLFTNLLNYHMPKTASDNKYVKAQEALQLLEYEYIDREVITDAVVQRLFAQCQEVMDSHKIDVTGDTTQIFRGLVTLSPNTSLARNCNRHALVFEKFQIIPEECFDCYKVTVKPRTVMELFKLMLVFDSIDLPKDNLRKCMVEVRPNISGAYKGFVYCQGVQEAKDLLELVQQTIYEKISKHIPVSVKRGCSEYPPIYPEYEHIDDDSNKMMQYNEQWRHYEEYTDKNLTKHLYPPTYDTHNHKGFTLRDAQVMQEWLSYAAMIGDLSYIKIFDSPVVHKLLTVKRPPFQAVGDG